MSWTIEASLTDSKDLALFEEAIKEANNKNILMFCATSDQGSISSENCYPGKWGNCIKIGAATALGDKCTWVPNDHFEYLLPGKDIPFKWKRPDGISSWYESGSSLSTALAFGLSGLLLYCDRVVKGKEPRGFHTKTAISGLFRKPAVTTMGTKYVRADYWFGKRFRSYIQLVRNEKAETQFRSSVNTSSEPLSQLRWSEESRLALARLLTEMKEHSWVIARRLSNRNGRCQGQLVSKSGRRYTLNAALILKKCSVHVTAALQLTVFDTLQRRRTKSRARNITTSAVFQTPIQ